MPSSGTLPLSSYYRVEALGSGTYGSVLTVYDEDGKEFALKLFLDETDDEQDSIYTDTNSDEEISYEYDSDQDSEAEEQDFSCTTMDLGALREISILRLLRDSNGHPNIVQIHDVKLADEMSPDQEDKGRGEMSHIGITMPVFPHGTLSQAIDSNRFNTKRQKIDISHGLLSAVAFLHINGIIHRDMKGDNVMIEIQADGTYKPILIDFSLAKIIEPRALYSYKCTSPEENNFWEGIDVSIHGEDTHTPSVGTPTYRAPEVVGEKPYGLASDMYSVGAVLLELLIGKTLEVVKDRGAQRLVSEYKDKLPDQPKSSVLIMVEVRESRSTLKLMLTLKRRRVLTLFRRFGSHHYFFVHY